jgi:protein SCO1/2
VNRTHLTNAIALCALLLATGTVFAWMTRGFQAVTSDRARQVELRTRPRLVPDVTLIDSHGRLVRFRELVGSRKYTVVALVYTQCTTLCLLTASSESYVQEQTRKRGLEDVGLLTISFDPARDTPAALARYARRVKAEPGRWTIATVANPADLDRLLDTFGIVVLPQPDGEFIHNGALFIVDREGRLLDAVDPDASDLVIPRLAALVSP